MPAELFAEVSGGGGFTSTRIMKGVLRGWPDISHKREIVRRLNDCGEPVAGRFAALQFSEGSLSGWVVGESRWQSAASHGHVYRVKPDR